MAFLSVSIDLDEIDCYLAIHGLHGDAAGGSGHPVYERALPRIADFFDDLEIEGTLFVVGQDIVDSKRAADIRSFTARGHEIGNHTNTHPYDFSLKPTDIQSREIATAHDAILQATGSPPIGFRSPGYNTNMGIIELIKQHGYTYDSSIFPCPTYYAAKAGAIGIKSLLGRQSKSIMGDPRILTSPTTPYRIGEDGVWCRSKDGLKELPITVVTKARLPFIGTSVAMMGKLPVKMLAKQAAKMKVVNFELHGMDFLDADSDGLAFLKPHQPDLKIPLRKRRDRLETGIKTLLDAGLEPVPLREMAMRLFL